MEHDFDYKEFFTAADSEKPRPTYEFLESLAEWYQDPETGRWGRRLHKDMISSRAVARKFGIKRRAAFYRMASVKEKGWVVDDGEYLYLKLDEEKYSLKNVDNEVLNLVRTLNLNIEIAALYSYLKNMDSYHKLRGDSSFYISRRRTINNILGIRIYGPEREEELYKRFEGYMLFLNKFGLVDCIQDKKKDRIYILDVKHSIEPEDIQLEFAEFEPWGTKKVTF